jgi:hypothetical protein
MHFNSDVAKFGALGLAALGLGIAAGGEAVASSLGHSGLVLHPVWHTLYNPMDGLKLLGQLDSTCITTPHLNEIRNTWPQFKAHPLPVVRCPHVAAINALNEQVKPWLAGALLPALGFAAAAKKATEIRPGGIHLPRPKYGPGHVSICIGKSSGQLHQLEHVAGLKRKQKIYLIDEDLHQDLFLVGGKGAGKTRLMSSIALQAFRQACGGLFFNIKGDVDSQLARLAARAGRKIRIIGIGGESVNMMNGGRMTPDMVATYTQSLLLLVDRNPNSSFWSQMGANLTRAVAQILYFIDGQYSLPGVYRFLFVDSFQAMVMQEISEFMDRLRDAYKHCADADLKKQMADDGRAIESAIQEIKNHYNQSDDVQKNVGSQLTQILSRMVVPEVEDAFFNSKPTAKSFDLKDTYEKGEIFCINIPIQLYGPSARAIMALFKFMYYTTADQRRLEMAKPGSTVNRTTRVILGIDECQAIAVHTQDGMSDDKFLATSRDTLTINVWATQSIPALNAAIGKDGTDAVLANLRTRVYFRGEDLETIDDVMRLLGTTEVEKETVSRDRGGKRSVSKAKHTQPIANASHMRRLKFGDALLIGSIRGVGAQGCEAADDIIKTIGVSA